MLDLQRQYEQVRAEVLAAVGRVCASQHYILGMEVEAFERELADFCGARDAVGCASGTDALWLALVAAGVQPGDQVLTTPFSFFASASAVARAGARPVFADIDPGTLNLDPRQVESFLRIGRRDKLRALGQTECGIHGCIRGVQLLSYKKSQRLRRCRLGYDERSRDGGAYAPPAQ